MHEKLTKCPNFTIFTRKIPEFYMTLLKNILPIFWGWDHPAPVSYAYAEKCYAHGHSSHSCGVAPVTRTEAI